MTRCGWREDSRSLTGEFATASFQRYRRPTGKIAEAPPSHGALPLLLRDDEAWLPLYEDEAFWLGLAASTKDVAVLVTASVQAASGRLNAVSGQPWEEDAQSALVVPPTQRLPGIGDGRGAFWAFARGGPPDAGPACTSLDLSFVPSEPTPWRPSPADPNPRQQDLQSPGGQPRMSQDEPPRRWRPDREQRLHILLVDPASWLSATGEDLPRLDPEATYARWRLP